MDSLLLEGRYRLGEVLGEGGMAVVYRATDTRLQRPVAVKLLRDQYASVPALVERLQREARAAATLSHPSIVAVFDVGSEGSTHFIVMEYVEGEDLQRILRREHRLAPDRLIRLGVQIAEALDYAHRRGLVHRDVKPHNVLVGRDGQAKVVDFGIAAVLGVPSLTPAGTVLGSPHYLSPEQARGEECTPASDVYSTGVLLYEMATGRPPFQAENPAALARMHVEVTPLPASDLNRGLPRGLDEIVMRALAKEPERRFRSAAELAGALREYEAGSGRQTQSQGVYRLEREPARLRRAGNGRPARSEVGAGDRSLWRLLPGLAPAAGVALAFLLFAVAAVAAVQAGRSVESAQATATALSTRGAATAESLWAQGTAVSAVAPTVAARIQAAATAESRTAATVQALQGTATSLAAAAATATAEAREAAAARAAQATTIAVAAEALRLYGADDGRLDHRPDGMSSLAMREGIIFPAPISLRNFVVAVRFHNPYDPTEGKWDYGLGFRSAGTGEGYRLYLNSDGAWHFELVGSAGGKLLVDPLASGPAPSARLARNSSNLLTLTVKGKGAFFYVNGEYLATLDASHRDTPGEVWIATGFVRGHTLAGRATRYQDFKVWVVP